MPNNAQNLSALADVSLEVDCHAATNAAARNDDKTATSQSAASLEKGDSGGNAQALESTFDKNAERVFDSHAAGGRIFLKKHRLTPSGIPCFATPLLPQCLAMTEIWILAFVPKTLKV